MTGCGELRSFSNDFDVVRSDVSSVKPANEPTTQNDIPLGTIPPPTPESRHQYLRETWEGYMLLFGWGFIEAEEHGYDFTKLTEEEREFYIQDGIDILGSYSELKNAKKCAEEASRVLLGYFCEKRDLKKAMYWAFKGAENGSSFCMSFLSAAYRSGEGVVQDLEEGIKWMYLGAAAGDAGCKQWVQKNGILFLTDENFAPIMREAKKRANQWMQDHPDIFISAE